MATVIDLTGNVVKADSFDGAVTNTDLDAVTPIGEDGLDITLSTSGGNTYTDAAVKAAVDAQLAEVQAKFDALLAALKG